MFSSLHIPIVPFAVENDEDVAAKNRCDDLAQFSGVSDRLAKAREEVAKALRVEMQGREHFTIVKRLRDVPALTVPPDEARRVRPDGWMRVLRRGRMDHRNVPDA
jgi:hypothetical protein